MVRRVPISHLRGSGSFRRRPGQKAPRSITLIVCEGETEEEYFEVARVHYGLTTAEVVVAPNTIGSAPISVVEFAERKCAEPGGYDKVFCVFDRDGHESFERARELIRALAARERKPLPIVEVISIPCFEYWVLLHFERTDAPFDRCAAVVQRLRSHLPGYEKADAAIARRLMDDLGTAIDNAEWTERRAAGNKFNPFTAVHHLHRHLQAVANPNGDHG